MVAVAVVVVVACTDSLGGEWLGIYSLEILNIYFANINDISLSRLIL